VSQVRLTCVARPWVNISIIARRIYAFCTFQLVNDLLTRGLTGGAACNIDARVATQAVNVRLRAGWGTR
jgi:hypothetical protein